MAKELSVVRGTTNTFGLAIEYANGDDFTLEPSQVLVFGLKRKPHDEECVLVKTINHSVDGAFYLELEPSDTAELEAGTYFYDVGLQHGDSVFYNVIKPSVFKILPNITELGDGS